MNNIKMTKVTFIKSCNCSVIYKTEDGIDGITLVEFAHKCDTHKDLGDADAFAAAAELERMANLGDGEDA